MTTQRRRFLALGLVLAAGAFLAFPGPASAQLSDQNKFRASVRISGGAGFSLNGGGDLELERLGIAEYFSDIGSLTGYTVTQNWKKMSLIPDVEVDFIFNLTDRFQLGVGSGYVRASSKGDYSYDYKENGTVSWGTYSYNDCRRVQPELLPDRHSHPSDPLLHGPHGRQAQLLRLCRRRLLSGQPEAHVFDGRDLLL